MEGTCAVSPSETPSNSPLITECSQCGNRLQTQFKSKNQLQSKNTNEASGTDSHKLTTSQSISQPTSQSASFGLLDSYVLVGNPTQTSTSEAYAPLSSFSNDPSCDTRATEVEIEKVSHSISNTFSHPLEPVCEVDLYTDTFLEQKIDEILQNQAHAIEHPLCTKCADAIAVKLIGLTGKCEQEATLYQEAIERLGQLRLQVQASHTCHDFEKEQTASRTSSPTHSEISPLTNVEHDEVSLRNYYILLHDTEKLNFLEQIQWLQFTKSQLDFFEHEQEIAVTNRAIEYASEQLNFLQRSNVINDTFHIWHDGPIGTINGIRLGKTSANPVSWDEINAAWGQVCLLVEVLLKKVSCVTKSGRILPRGSYSMICKSDQTQLELYYYEGGLSRFFHVRRFDQAMTIFLNCVEELSEHLKKMSSDKSNTRFDLPYKIEGDMIGNVSIKYHSAHEDLWSKALKYLLIDLKFLIACVVEITTQSAESQD